MILSITWSDIQQMHAEDYLGIVLGFVAWWLLFRLAHWGVKRYVKSGFPRALWSFFFAAILFWVLLGIGGLLFYLSPNPFVFGLLMTSGMMVLPLALCAGLVSLVVAVVYWLVKRGQKQ